MCVGLMPTLCTFHLQVYAGHQFAGTGGMCPCLAKACNTQLMMYGGMMLKRTV